MGVWCIIGQSVATEWLKLAHTHTHTTITVSGGHCEKNNLNGLLHTMFSAGSSRFTRVTIGKARRGGLGGD